MAKAKKETKGTAVNTKKSVEEYITDDKRAREVVAAALKEGCLLKIRTTGWGNRAKLGKDEVEEISEDFTTGSKDLIDKKALKEIKACRRRAINWARINCLPWLDDGVYFIPRHKIEEGIAVLDEEMTKQRAAVNELVAQYDELKDKMCQKVEDANAKNGTSIKFDESQYPSKSALKQRFSISYQFFMVTVPEAGGILDRKQIEREQRKLNETIKEAAEVGILYVRQQFAELVVHLKDKLETGGKFKNASVANLQEFLDKFNDLNVWQDRELKALIDQTRKAINGVDPEDLRNDDKFAAKVEGDMKAVVDGIKALGDQRLKRAVDF